MLRTFLSVVLIAFVSALFAQQAFIPLDPQHTPLIQSYIAKSKTNKPTGFGPYLIPMDRLDSIFDADTKGWQRKEYKSWVMRKLKNEHLFEVTAEDFRLKGDATFNLEASTQTDPQGRRMFTNTRGYNFYGSIGNHLIFNTSFNETQSIFPNYMDSVVSARGSVDNTRDPERGSVPGFTRWKPFNTSASYDYDYAFATGTVSYAFNENNFIQFGNDKQFMGYGYRSLFLSDASTAYPFLRWRTSFWKNRITYTTTWAMLQSLDHFDPNLRGDRLFHRLGARFSYLHFQPVRWIGLGLFDGTTWTWRHNAEPMSIEYYMPYTFVYTKAGIRNHIIGLNGFITPLKYLMAYAQAGYNSIGSGKAVQLGMKVLNLRGFSATIEFNKISQGFYHNGQNLTGFENKVVVGEPFDASITGYSDYYQNNDLFLAHPLGVQLTEVLTKGAYRWRDFMVNASYYHIVKTPIVNTDNVIQFVQLEAGYIINPKSNASLVAGVIKRNEVWADRTMITNYPYIAFRTNLFNRYMDF